MSEVIGVDIVNAKLQRLLAIGGLDKNAHLEIGNQVKSEIVQNFRVGGRPEAWIKSQRVLRSGGQTLRRSGHLMNSMTVAAGDDGSSVGTNLVYARIHALGGTIDRHPHSRLGVTMKTFKSGKNKGKTLFAKTGREGSFTRNVTVGGSYTITIPQRDYRYMSPRGTSVIVMIAARHIVARATNG